MLKADNEEFMTIDLEQRFRVYTNVQAGICELERMNRDGEVEECVASCTFGVTNPNFATQNFPVLRFRCFLECWADHSDCMLDEKQAQTVFDSLLTLTTLSLDNS